MARSIEKIASELGAKVIAQLPETGGGAFGAARLARLVKELQARLAPGQGRRAGRPTERKWIRHPKVPMSTATQLSLVRLAEQASTPKRKISPMQLAAQILEDALNEMPEARSR
jgi:hypothetical protein